MTRQEFSVPGGSMFVDVMPAREMGEWSADAILTVSWVPRLHLSTSPEPFSEQRLGGVKVRGRTYAINAIYERVGDEWKFVNPLYRGGYMNSDGRPLALESGVHATLRKLEHEVLAEYINQHPRWSAVSERKGLEVEIAEAYGEEILAREKIARLRNRLAMLRSRSTQLPTTC